MDDDWSWKWTVKYHLTKLYDGNIWDDGTIIWKNDGNMMEISQPYDGKEVELQ